MISHSDDTRATNKTDRRDDPGEPGLYDQRFSRITRRTEIYFINHSKTDDVHKFKYIIGIDPGTKTGLCVWNPITQSIQNLVTCPIHKAMESILFLHDRNKADGILVRVEDARKATFGRSSQIDNYKAQGAGSVKRDCSIWEDYLTDMNIPFEMCRPRKAATKLDADTFFKITKYSALTSSHARDAAMLVFGLGANHILSPKK